MRVKGQGSRHQRLRRHRSNDVVTRSTRRKKICKRPLLACSGDVFANVRNKLFCCVQSATLSERTTPPRMRGVNLLFLYCLQELLVFGSSFCCSSVVDATSQSATLYERTTPPRVRGANQGSLLIRSYMISWMIEISLLYYGCTLSSMLAS